MSMLRISFLLIFIIGCIGHDRKSHSDNVDRPVFIEDTSIRRLFYDYDLTTSKDSILIFSEILNFEKSDLRQSWLSFLHEVLYQEVCMSSKYSKYSHFQSKLYAINDSSTREKVLLHMTISLKLCDTTMYSYLKPYYNNINLINKFTDYVLAKRHPVESAVLEDIYSGIRSQSKGVDTIGVLMEMYVVYQEKVLYNKEPDSNYYIKIRKLRTNIENKGEDFSRLLNMVSEIDSLIKNTK